MAINTLLCKWLNKGLLCNNKNLTDSDHYPTWVESLAPVSLTDSEGYLKNNLGFNAKGNAVVTIF